MFSQQAKLVRRAVMRDVLDLDSSVEYEDELDVLDPDTLTEAERDLFEDLEDLEEQFNDYSNFPFKPNLASFAPGAQLFSTSDPFSVLTTLSPSDCETQHINHRLRGLQSLIPELQAILSSHPSLLAQRDDLIAATNDEIRSMLAKLWDEFNKHTTSDSSNLALRRVPVDILPINPYSSPLVTSVLVLTAIIHAVMGVARTNCNFILSSIKALVSMVSNMHGNQPSSFIRQYLNEIPNTLPTVLHRLNLSPVFDMYACCPECSTLYPQSKGSQNLVPATCTARCAGSSNDCGATLCVPRRRGDRTWQKPLQRYSHMRFETWVSELLLRPRVEDMLESGRPNRTPGPVASDVWDAPYLRTFPSHSDSSFMTQSNDELCLAMMLYFDFFNPFTIKGNGKTRSVGCIFMVCLNLPPDVRYNPSNAYLVSMIPGPSKTPGEDLHHFIKPIVDDMLEMYDPGIWVSKTHKYPRGRRVRAAIALKGMDLEAAYEAGGFARVAHTCFCYLCTAVKARIDHPNLGPFQPRTIESHRRLLAEAATSPAKAEEIFSKHGIRNIDWLRFKWWNPFESIVIGPMHWTKNVLEKQLWKNMNWSWEISFGISDTRISKSKAQPITKLEYEWGCRAFLCLDEKAFSASKLTAPLIKYMCRQRKIYEAGLASERLLHDLNEYRKAHGIITPDGKVADHIKARFGEGVSVGVARAHYYVSRESATLPTVLSNSKVDDLIALCRMLNLSETGDKDELSSRLLTHYEGVSVPVMEDEEQPSKKKQVSILGREVLTEVKQDMERTILPGWLKTPPKTFAEKSHGTLKSEEYKSLALVPLTITLVRLWGVDGVLLELQDRLNHFLHLTICIRILAYQSITESDIEAFEFHYSKYLEGLKLLYPSCSVVPVQHLGLHIPQFLRALGPSTRWSESTCEQFIGMFQNISTNFKFGDLELTLHREFVMASRLKGMIDQRSFTEPLADFGQIVEDFLQQHVPSQNESTWKTAHDHGLTLVLADIHKSLTHWAVAHTTQPFARSLYHCTSIRFGNVVYAPHSSSLGNSSVMFGLPHMDGIFPGRIEFILEEPVSSSHLAKPRIMLVVRTFQRLNHVDAQRDPYLNHPIIGQNGADLARLYYNDLEPNYHTITPRDIVSHIAVCEYTDNVTFPERRIPRGCIVVLSLDLKHARFA